MAISGIEVHDECNAWVEKIRKGEVGGVFFEIRKGPDGLDWVFPLEDESAFLPPKASIEDLRATLGERFSSKSLYGIFDFNAREEDGRIIQKAFFLYWSPDEAPVSEKVKYGTTKEGIAGSFKFCANLGQCTDLMDIEENRFRSKINLAPKEAGSSSS